VADRVLANPRRHLDTFQAALPAEITVAGSSGVGPLAPHQGLDELALVLAEIASNTQPIEASFGPVIRFEGTDIFVLTLEDTTPIDALHQRIARCPIRFQSTPFPFLPHCTLRSRSPVTAEEATDLLETVLPGSFVLETLSVYTLDGLPMTLRYRTRLGG
jgi:hypothetical protein